MFDLDKIMVSIKESFAKERAEKERLYRPLDNDTHEYLHRSFLSFGRMVSSDKSMKECVYNANLCTKTYGKIWYGDINLEKDKDKLQELATKVGEKIYVLREYDARFQNEVHPLFDNAVVEYDPN